MTITMISIACMFVQLVKAEAHKWVDDKGTMHFTEDYDTIPEKYRNQFEKISMLASGPSVPSHERSYQYHKNEESNPDSDRKAKKEASKEPNDEDSSLSQSGHIVLTSWSAMDNLLGDHYA